VLLLLLLLLLLLDGRYRTARAYLPHLAEILTLRSASSRRRRGYQRLLLLMLLLLMLLLRLVGHRLRLPLHRNRLVGDIPHSTEGTGCGIRTGVLRVRDVELGYALALGLGRRGRGQRHAGRWVLGGVRLSKSWWAGGNCEVCYSCRGRRGGGCIVLLLLHLVLLHIPLHE